jgi:hypothetical protein
MAAVPVLALLACNASSHTRYADRLAGRWYHCRQWKWCDSLDVALGIPSQHHYSVTCANYVVSSSAFGVTASALLVTRLIAGTQIGLRSVWKSSGFSPA